MNLKGQVIAINKFLSDVYCIEDMRLSFLLAQLNFAHKDIKLIKQQLLPNIVAIFLNILEKQVTGFSDGFQKFTIIEDVYGLNGNPSLKLREVGGKFNLSRERIRQIKNKVIRQLKSKHNISSRESEFAKKTQQLLISYNRCGKLEIKEPNHLSKFNFSQSSLALGEVILTITEGNNKIVLDQSNFLEFYNNLLFNIKSLNWNNNCQVSKIKIIREKYSRASEIWTEEEEQWLRNYLAEG